MLVARAFMVRGPRPSWALGRAGRRAKHFSRGRRPRRVDEESAPRGDRFVLGLFAVLAVATIGVLALFASLVEPAYRQRIYVALVANLLLPLFAAAVFVAIEAKRNGRSGWWIYLAAAPLPPVNLLLSLVWVWRWRHSPITVGRWEL